MAEDGDFFCAMGVHVRDAMADLYRPFWATSIIAQLGGFDNPYSDMYDVARRNYVQHVQ